MKDAIGNVYSLGFVFAFILIVASFLAYVINYNRAFQVKNKLLEIIKENGHAFSATDYAEINSKLSEYKKEIGYSAGIDYLSAAKADGWTCPQNYGWCYKQYPDPDIYKCQDINYTYVKVMTFVSIDIPVINKFFAELTNFRVTGSTVPSLTVQKKDCKA